MLEAPSSDLVGDFKWPPGFRFHPTDEEMVLYYLKRKICRRRLRLNVIRELDVYKWDPEDLPGLSLLKTGDRQWFFFSRRDHRYPNGGRANRATAQGYWKATGKDRNITCNSRSVGVKKTLVFYRGRAPTGERTDWVMHEYTLDEEELKRCPNVQDYYALYKVFKKSGPGPKNGEQYGAPFREEDWVDDETSIGNLCVPEVPTRKKIELPPVCNEKAVCQVDPVSLDVFDILKEIVEEPKTDSQLVTEYCPLLQVDGEEAKESTLVDSTLKDFTIPELIEVSPGKGQQYDNQANFIFECSDNSKSELHEAPELTCAAKNPDPAPQLSEGDFLEMDDLLGLGLECSYVEEPVGSLLFDDIDGLSPFELYHDTAMFLRDMGPLGQETIAQSFGDNVVHEMGHQYQHCEVNQINYEAQLDLETSQFDFSWRPESTVNEVRQQHLQTQPYNDNCISNEKQSNMTNKAETNYGVMCDSVECWRTNEDQGGNGTDDDGSSGWFSSVMWSLVDSIPSEPALAAEGPILKKGLGRMSSFRSLSLRMKVVNSNVAVICSNSNGTEKVRKAGAGGNKGLMLLSVLGVLVAILWVLIGNVKLLGIK
ncbi:NAC domain-containing protein 17 [Linum perenne]